MRFVAVVLCVLALVGCQHPPPAYESRYTPSTSTAPAQPPPAGASFLDDFERPDTPLGLGDGWETLGQFVGRFPLPPATDGFIKGGRYTFAGDALVTAAREFRGTVFRTGFRGRWEEIRPGAEGRVVMGISANNKLFSDMVQFSVTRQRWGLAVRRNDGKFHPVANGRFSPPLELQHDYTFEITLPNSGQVIVHVPGNTTTARVGLKGVQGDWGFWGFDARADELPVGTVFGFDSVWAAEDGQLLRPLPGENGS